MTTAVGGLVDHCCRWSMLTTAVLFYSKHIFPALVAKLKNKNDPQKTFSVQTEENRQFKFIPIAFSMGKSCYAVSVAKITKVRHF